MITKEEIIEITQGHPTIQRMFLRFYEKEKFTKKTTLEAVNCLIQNKKELAPYGINYSQVKNLDTLINFINKILNKRLKNEKGKTKEEIIKELQEDNMKFYEKENIIEFEVETFEQMKRYGSKNWCVSQNIKWFKEYKNIDNRFILALKFEDGVLKNLDGLTITKNNKIYRVYNKKNEKITDYKYYSLVLNKELEYEKDIQMVLLKNLVFFSFGLNSYIIFNGMNSGELSKQEMINNSIFSLLFGTLATIVILTLSAFFIFDIIERIIIKFRGINIREQMLLFTASFILSERLFVFFIEMMK